MWLLLPEPREISKLPSFRFISSISMPMARINALVNCSRSGFMVDLRGPLQTGVIRRAHTNAPRRKTPIVNTITAKGAAKKVVFRGAYYTITAQRRKKENNEPPFAVDSISEWIDNSLWFNKNIFSKAS